ncbi:hypothetical protein B0T16DRAFT_107302 [Cercophora newfieldiana]|uniref:Microsomal glutathione S-transferase 3 n=1 Tax=Cercophora newfieldiana TaxID=92897 RepID=A0AA39YJY7_9PEZI|nr:hypothetical protein B0T16DRAFT_107302 [Cercophora newfieldiana]
MAITLPAEYGYVLLAATSTFFVNIFHSGLTSKARKAANIAYPTCYASTELAEKDPKAHKFNCAQRAHANFTESLTPFLGELLIAGLRFPFAAAIAGGVWAFARVLYAQGYTSSGPKGRMVGSLVATLVDIGMKLTAAYASVMFVLEK